MSRKQQNPFEMLYPNANNIEDPIERHIARQVRNMQPYCKYCGKEIVNADQDSEGTRTNSAWEISNKAHYICHMQDAEAKQRKAEREKQIDWDDYMSQMMRGREDGTDDR